MQLGIENSVATNEDKNEDGSETDEIMEEEDVEEKHVVYQITYGTLAEKEEDGIIDDDGSKYTNENFDGWSYEEQEEENFEEKEYTEENSDSWSYDEQEEDNVQEEEEEAIAKMSTEELNRKFDDFIRKMKDELRIEARQQLIVV